MPPVEWFQLSNEVYAVAGYALVAELSSHEVTHRAVTYFSQLPARRVITRRAGTVRIHKRRVMTRRASSEWLVLEE